MDTGAMELRLVPRARIEALAGYCGRWPCAHADCAWLHALRQLSAHQGRQVESFVAPPTPEAA